VREAGFWKTRDWSAKDAKIFVLSRPEGVFQEDYLSIYSAVKKQDNSASSASSAENVFCNLSAQFTQNATGGIYLAEGWDCQTSDRVICRRPPCGRQLGGSSAWRPPTKKYRKISILTNPLPILFLASLASLAEIKSFELNIPKAPLLLNTFSG
jgi:hypothetical protein